MHTSSQCLCNSLCHSCLSFVKFPSTYNSVTFFVLASFLVTSSISPLCSALTFLTGRASCSSFTTYPQIVWRLLCNILSFSFRVVRLFAREAVSIVFCIAAKFSLISVSHSESRILRVCLRPPSNPLLLSFSFRGNFQHFPVSSHRLGNAPMSPIVWHRCRCTHHRSSLWAQ